MCRSRCCLTPVTKSLSCVFGERIIQLRSNGEKSEGNSTGCITSSCDDVIYARGRSLGKITTIFQNLLAIFKFQISFKFHISVFLISWQIS